MGGLGGVADAVGADAFGYLRPIQGRAAEVMGVILHGGRRVPVQIFRIVNTALNGGEHTAFFCHFYAFQHGVEAHEFHYLGGEFLAFRRSVADAGMEHQVGQAHDAQPQPAGAHGVGLQLRYSRHVAVGIHHIVQETSGQMGSMLQRFPIHFSVG